MTEPTEKPMPPESNPAIDDALSAEIIRLTDALDACQAKLNDKELQYTRLYADFDNFRRRTLREKEDLKVTAAEGTLLELLPILDNFERAKSQIVPENEREEAISNSYQAIYKQFSIILEKFRVLPIPALEQPFDPNLHEAIAHEPSELYSQETVIAEFQKGYYLGDKVLRHALVKVATPSTIAGPA